MIYCCSKVIALELKEFAGVENIECKTKTSKDHTIC